MSDTFLSKNSKYHRPLFIQDIVPEILHMSLLIRDIVVVTVNPRYRIWDIASEILHQRYFIQDIASKILHLRYSTDLFSWASWDWLVQLGDTNSFSLSFSFCILISWLAATVVEYSEAVSIGIAGSVHILNKSWLNLSTLFGSSDKIRNVLQFGHHKNWWMSDGRRNTILVLYF